MEALHFFKLWKQNPSQKGEDLQFFSSTQNTGLSTMWSKNSKPGRGEQQLEEEGDDSFFELELITATSSNDDYKNPIGSNDTAEPLESYSFRFEFDPFSHSFTISKPKKAGHFLELGSDSISKRKVRHIEPGSKPQSPISLLKSASSLKVLTFKKSKSMARRDLSEISSCSPVLGRDNSLRRYIREDTLTGSNVDEEWKLGKYLRLIYRPLNSRKEKTTRVFSSGSPSPSCSPVAVDSPPWKKLGKSKSSAVAVAAPARRDDSLALHHDGIQSAILHCKKSFNSSRDPSFLSRFACETLQDYGKSPSDAKLAYNTGAGN